MSDHMSGKPDLMAVPGLPGTTPLPVFDTALAGVRQYYAITTAFDLRLFELLREPATASECADSLGCQRDMIGLLCNCLESLGLLEKTKDRFQTSAQAQAFLIQNSPFCQGHAIAFQRRLASLWANLPAIVKDGPVTYERAPMFRDVIIPSMAENCRCGLLQQVASFIAALPEFPAAKQLLDLGGGHGLYAIALCQKNPGLEATVFDLPPVTEATRDFIAHYHAERVRVIPGDFFTDPIGEGYDIIFSSSNPGGKIPALIPKIASALNDGGLFINKQAIDEAPEDPFMSFEWNLWTFQGIKKQAKRFVFSDSVTLADYNRELASHGFVVRDLVPIDAQSAMTIAQKSPGTDSCR